MIAYVTIISILKLHHAPLFSMDDKPNVELPYPEWDAKNLFIRDHKREHYYLITVRGSKRI